MNYGQAHTPVILLLDNADSSDGRFIRQWLSDSRFMTCEADNAFHVLEEMSDFTMRNRPDVIILSADSPADDLRSIRQLVGCAASEPDTAIIWMTQTTAEDGPNNFSARNAVQVAARLEQLIPDLGMVQN